jgi:serine protease Do
MSHTNSSMTNLLPTIARNCLLVGAVILFATSTSRAAEDLQALEERALLAAVERVSPSVVSIETVGGIERLGSVMLNTGPTTGLVISADGYIISSAYGFVQKPTSILIGFSDGTRAPAKLVATDRSCMLALLKTDVDERLKVPKLSPEKDWRVGQWAIAVGRTFEGRQTNMSVGIVSALGRVWGKAVQTDAKVSPSNYGGPLVDIRGRVMGVLVPLSPDKTGEMAGVEWYDSGIGFAVPLERVFKVLPRLREGHDLLPGLLGVSLKAEDLYAETPTITSARPNSPAYQAGLRAGDKIVAIDGHKIERMVQLTREIQGHYAGDKVRVSVTRGEERLERELELASKIDPYRRPFLGILPGHDTSFDPGVVVRYVYPKSPADDSGIMIGDRLVEFEGQPLVDRDALAERVALSRADKPVRIEIARGDEKLKFTVKLGTEPTDVPKDLPLEKRAVKPPAGDRPPVGQLPLKVGEFSNTGVVYVPETYDPEVGYGLIVWLHGPDGFEDEKLIADWQFFCLSRGFILLAPKAAQKASWTAGEKEFVSQAISQIRDRYNIDPLRIATVGRRSGGALAYLLAFEDRETIRGLAAIQSRLPTKPQENDPEHRLAFYLVMDKEMAEQPAVKLLREAEYPVTLQEADDSPELSDGQKAELWNWLDTLDKI